MFANRKLIDFLKMNDSSLLQLRYYSVISTKVRRIAKDIVTSIKGEPIIGTRCLEVNKGHYWLSQAYQVNPYSRQVGTVILKGNCNKLKLN